MTKRFNTDCIENFFGAIRQQGGSSINPTPIQFERAFKKLFCQSYLHSNNMNCKDDLDEILMNLRSENILQSGTSELESTDKRAIPLEDYDYRREELVTQNAFKYVCGYLLRKTLNIHSCDVCVKFSKDCELLDDSLLLTHFKAFDQEKSIFGGLSIPSEEFIHYIY